MFSDKFVEVNNYSLFRKEYLDTSSLMPWIYTSIFDNQYAPELPDQIKNRLQLLFFLKLQYTVQLLEDDKKYIEITNKNGNIKEFRAINPIRLIAFSEIREWKYFINTIEAPELDPCREKLFNYTNKDIVMTGVTSVTYDKDCNATGCYFQYDSTHLVEHSELSKKLCIVSSMVDDCISTIHVRPDDDYLRYKITPIYHGRTLSFERYTHKKSLLDCSNARWEKVKYSTYTEKCLSILLEQQIITEEMAQYINEVIPEDSKIELEYLISASGELTDIILKNTIIDEFKILC